jgi:hypothetical protein
VVSAVAGVSAGVSAEADGFGLGRRGRRGFDVLVFELVMVVEELEFCADTTSPTLISAPKIATMTIERKG